MNEQLELIPQNTIRIETALSRFPVHRLSKRGNINIEIRETTPAGELKTKWEVDYPKRTGQPGQLAYKVDTLIVNRRIDDKRPSIPKIIQLGSLSEICRELGMRVSGGNSNGIKKALRQNAFAGITAKITYRATDGTERSLEAAFTRYSVIFTGEKFPDGRRANAVYVILNDVYMKILKEAQTRPLDYDYLRDLPPAAQRFYELIGFQVHAPHLKSGYLAKVEFQAQPKEGGETDWLMLYTPGRRAEAEFKEASRKPRVIQRPSATPRPVPAATAEPPARQDGQPISPQAAEPPTAIHEADDTGEQLVSKLVAFRIAEATARELVRDYRKSVELQLRALPHRQTGKIKELAPWLIQAVKDNYELPEALRHALEKEEEVKRQLAKREAEQTRQRRREALQPVYYDFLRGREAEHQSERQQTYNAFLEREAQERAEIENNRIFKSKFRKHRLDIFDHPESHLDRLRAYFGEPTLDEWLERTPDPS